MLLPNLADIWKEKCQSQTYGYIGDHKPLQKNKNTYLTVTLESTSIPYIRKGLDKFYGTLYGSVALSSDSNSEMSFQTVTTLPSLTDIEEMDTDHLDRVITGTLCLLDDVPYRQEGLFVNLYLFSIQSASIIEPYITLLKSIADTAGVAFLSQAVPLADVIRKGITGLVGPNELEIGLCKGFPIVEEGYYAVIRTDGKALPLSEFSLDPETHRLVYQDRIVTELPYFILRFQFSDTRENWKQIPEIQKSYKNLIDHCHNLPPEYKLNQRAFDLFEADIKLSDELLKPDKERFIALVHDQVIDFLEKPKTKNVRRQTAVAKTGLGTGRGVSRRMEPKTWSLTEPALIQINPEELSARLESEVKTLSLDKIQLFQSRF